MVVICDFVTIHELNTKIDSFMIKKTHLQQSYNIPATHIDHENKQRNRYDCHLEIVFLQMLNATYGLWSGGMLTKAMASSSSLVRTAPILSMYLQRCFMC